MKYYFVWFSSFLPILAVALLLALLPQPAAPGATFPVNSIIDATDANPGDGVCETAAGNGVCSLRAAVQEANSWAGADTITVPAGTYSITIDGVNENAAVSGDFDITEAVTIIGSGAGSTVIGGNELDRVFHIMAGDSAEVYISELSIRYGNAWRWQVGFTGEGGGLFNETSLVTLSQVEVNDNLAGREGGGLSSDATMVLIGASIHDNLAAMNGGGIHNRGVMTVTGSMVQGNRSISNNGGGITNESLLVVSSTTISENIASAGAGLLQRYGQSFLDDVTFSHNQGFTGGALEIWAGSIHVQGSTFISNTASHGGAIFLRLAHLYLIDSVVTGNTSEYAGGGIRMENYTVLMLDNSTVQQNQSLLSSGGGLYSAGRLLISNSTISNNSANAATGLGGGLYLLDAPAQATSYISNTTISGNAANQGGGIVFGDDVTILNSTIAGNSATDGAGLYDSLSLGGVATLKNTIIDSDGLTNCTNNGAIVSAGYNLESGNSCGMTGPGDLTNTDPELGLLQDNGGLTWTHALLPGSPAIDAGDNDGCPATDQRGMPRPMDGDDNGSVICDIGAYEVEGALPVTPTPTPTPADTPTATYTPTPTHTPPPTATNTPLPTLTATNTPSPTPTATAGPPSHKVYLPVVLIQED